MSPIRTNGKVFLGKAVYRTSIILLLCSFILTIPATNGAGASTQLQPLLAEMAITAPETLVPVIVQLQPATQPISELLARLGGKQTKDLSLINAVAAELPAAQLPVLAQEAAVRWISLDAPVVETGCTNCVPTDRLRSVYNQAVRAQELWNGPTHLQGTGIGVAVVDSGIQKYHPDLFGRVVAGKSTVLSPDGYDGYGHGTFVAGVIGGDNRWGWRNYIGVAPKSNLIDVKVTTLTGASTESDVVAGLQWIYENREAHNIRVVNISLNASMAQSYHTSPLSAACEILWFNGVVVVTSAGNHGEGTIYPPANDPFVITVGAADDMGTATLSDDTVAHFSAYGTTVDGFFKPDLVAPGRHLVAPMAYSGALLPLLRPEMKVDRSYMRMSGTSFAAPIVSGAIALLLEDEPHLTPDQVKYRLMATANREWPGYNAAKAGAGYLDVAAAVDANTTENANTGLPISHLLSTGTTGLGQVLGSLLSLNWDSVSWSSVSWSSVSWSSVSWSSVSWSSDYIEDEPRLPGVFGLLLREGEDPLVLETAADSDIIGEVTPDPVTADDASGIGGVEILENRIYLPLVLGSD